MAACLYFGFLLAGTLRPDSIEELLEWRKPDQGFISFQLTLGDSVSSLHGLFNIALFLPWGILGMFLGRKPIAALLCFFTATLMTFFIETYQLYHMRSFDFGDIFTNLLGCVIGIILVLPFAIFRHLKRKPT